MDIVLALGVVLILAFGAVMLVGAPYLPTLGKQVNSALDLLDLKKGQRLLELGAGDGTVALVALKRGYKVTAIELNPLLCCVIYLRTLRYRSNINIRCANFWTTDWGEYDGVYVFLLDKYMKRLDKRVIQENKTLRLASFAFKIPGKSFVHEHNDVYLYEYRQKNSR